MKTIQGFANIPDLANNDLNAIAEFGEISPKSLTFSRTIKNYSLSEDNPYVEIILFKTVDETSKDIDVPAFVSRTTIQVSNWLYAQAKRKRIPEDSQRQELETSIEGEFVNLTNSYGLQTNIKNVSVGEILPIPNTEYLLTEWVSFVLDDDGTEYAVKIWFSDQRFQLQYTFYEHVVIPPIGNIDSFNGTTPDVQTMLGYISANHIIAQINAITEVYPATNIYTMPIRWHNPENPNSTLETNWYTVVYGNAGIDADAVKNSIRSYIADNTEITSWTSIFPDLYAESEFILIPTWDQFSTPELGYDEGLYRSALTNEQLETIKLEKIPRSYNTVADFYAYLLENLVYMSVPYRSMMCLALGNPNNTEAKFSLLDVFPDYMNINPDSPDFNRLMLNTQKFIVKLSEAMHKARMWGPTLPLPLGYSLTNKQNREYIGFDYNGFTFYIMTRHGYLKDSNLTD